MSPTYTMSAHLCKQIAASWREMRQTSPEPLPLPSPPTASVHLTSYFHRAASPEKRSMDSDRSDVSGRRSPASAPAMSRQSSNSSDKFSGR